MLNLPEMPEAQNNIDRWGNGRGYFISVTIGWKNDEMFESIANVLTRIVEGMGGITPPPNFWMGGETNI